MCLPPSIYSGVNVYHNKLDFCIQDVGCTIHHDAEFANLSVFASLPGTPALEPAAGLARYSSCARSDSELLINRH